MQRMAKTKKSPKISGKVLRKLAERDSACVKSGLQAGAQVLELSDRRLKRTVKGLRG